MLFKFIESELPNIGGLSVGCSGEFTIETGFKSLKGVSDMHKIYSNDVSIYTNSIGYFLTDRDFNFEVKSRFEFLNEYRDKKLVYKTAVILYLSDIGEFYSGKGIYYDDMIKLLAKDHKRIIEKKVTRLKEIKQLVPPLEYYPEDVVEFVKRVDPKTMFVSFPPFWVGGYEKLYKIYDDVLQTSLTTKYKIFDGKSMFEMVETLAERKVPFVIGIAKDFCDLGRMVKDNNFVILGINQFSTNIWVYFVSNIHALKEKHGVIFGNDEESLGLGALNKHLLKKEELKYIIKSSQAEIKIKEIDIALFNAVRLPRLSPEIEAKNPMLKLGVFLNGKLAGVLGYGLHRHDCRGAYLLADVPVFNKLMLSKLIAGMGTSRIIKEYMSHKFVNEFYRVFTTAFTLKPSSMKYRGFWKVYNKNRGLINYVADFGRLHRKDIFSKWLSLVKKRL